MTSSINDKNVKYIYQLPAFERLEICKILDQDDKWEELAGKRYLRDILFDFGQIIFICYVVIYR